MPYASGRIIVSESGLGIPWLVVSLAHVAPPAADERLGSVITGEDGSFSLEYDVAPPAPGAAVGATTTTRPPPPPTRNLRLFVTAPESKGASKQLVSSKVRNVAGVREEFLVRIPVADLIAAEVTVPSESSNPAGGLDSVRREDARELALRRGERGAARRRVSVERAEHTAFEPFRKALVSHLSPAPGDLLKPGRRIDALDEVIAKNRKAVQDGVTNRFSAGGSQQDTRRARLHLDAAQIKLLKTLTKGGQALTTDGYRAVLAAGSGRLAGEPPVVVTAAPPMLRQAPARSARERATTKLLGADQEPDQLAVTPLAKTPPLTVPPVPVAELGADSPSSDHVTASTLAVDVGKPTDVDPAAVDRTTPAAEGPVPPLGPSAAFTTAAALLGTNAMIGDRLEDLLAGISAPEDPLDLSPGSIETRSSQEDVEATANAFALRPGPADVPALFDFHRLQIAFEHVWQEVLDDDLVEVAAAMHRTIRQLGGDPRLKDGEDPIRVLRRETALVRNASTPYPAMSQIALMRGGSDVLGRGGASGGVAGGGLLGGVIGGGGAGGGGVGDGGRRPRPDLPGPSTHTMDEPEIYSPPDSLLGRLLAMIEQAYPFTIYGAEAGSRSVNFGIVTTYRQTWTPVTYQVGRLVSTLPLTPGESRRVSSKEVVRTKRAERSMNRWDSLVRDESTTTSRAESEIVAKAQAKTNFELTTDGTYNLGVANGDSTTKLGRDAATDSSDTKRNFREAVIRAVQEYKQEHSTEITTDDSTETERSTTFEIKNDNNELHVTYLFYELQRRYRLHERLHRVTPVVMVAQEVPNPSMITDAWVIAHDWIIRRVLLDERLLPAMDYIAEHVAGDELAIAELGANVAAQRELVGDLRQNLRALETQATRRYEALLQAIEERARIQSAEDTDGFWDDVGDFFGGGGQSTAAAQIREDAARDAQQRAIDQVKDLQVRLQREITALNEITEKYAKLRSEHRNREVQIARLRLHVRQNILYYMQAIWTFEVPHQRFLRLHQVRVPRLLDQGTTYTVTGTTGGDVVTSVDTTSGALLTTPGVDVDVVPNLTLDATDDLLEEVADLDQLLGFHGNYMVFPLKQHNPLTEFLSVPYVDSGWRLIDPDEPEGMTLEEFVEYVQGLHDRLSPAEFAAVKGALKAKYVELINSPLRQGEEVVVPTDSLYIDALPGTKPLLEDFKLLHRGIDVRAAQARVRQTEMENLRFAARLLDAQLDDPEIDKRVVVQGSAAVLSSDG
jgi:hypothetical protein